MKLILVLVGAAALVACGQTSAPTETAPSPAEVSAVVAPAPSTGTASVGFGVSNVEVPVTQDATPTPVAESEPAPEIGGNIDCYAGEHKVISAVYYGSPTMGANYTSYTDKNGRETWTTLPCVLY